MRKSVVLVIMIAALAFMLAGTVSAEVLFKFPVEANEALAVGTVVRMDATTGKIVKATSADRDVVGVVVGYEGDGGTHYVLVASAGQVEVQVASAVAAGDRLTVSATAGQAATATNDEDVLIGIAMADGSGSVVAQIMVDDNQAKYSAYDHTGDHYITSDNVDGALGDLDTKIYDILAGSGTVNSLSDGDITTATDEGAGVWHIDVSTDAGDFVETGGVLALADNAIQSDEIEDGAIVNADVNASAAIAESKLAAGTDGQILSTVSGTPTWSDVSAVNQDLTDGAGIADFTYDGSAAATVAIDNGWFNGDATVDAFGVVTIQDDAVQASDVDFGAGTDQVDATDLTFTPTTPGDWTAAPTEAGGALDELANRVEGLEGGGADQNLNDVLTVGNSTGGLAFTDVSDGEVDVDDALSVVGNVTVADGDTLFVDVIDAEGGASNFDLAAHMDLNGHYINNSDGSHYGGKVAFNDNIVPVMTGVQDLGYTTYRWDDIFLGSSSVIDINGDAGAIGDVLTVDATGSISWDSPTANLQNHSTGNGLTGVDYNGSAAVTWTVDPGTGITVDASGVNVDYGNGAGTAVQGNVAWSVTAAGGLTGDASGVMGDGFSPTIAVGDGDGITVNADDIDVNVDGTTIEIDGSDNLHVLGAAPTGTAGGQLSGTYPDPNINTTAVGTGLSGGGGTALSVDYGAIANTAVQGNVGYDIGTAAAGGLTGGESGSLGDGIDMDLKLVDGAAGTDQLMKWNGSAWAPANISDLGGVNTSAPITGDGSSGTPVDLLFDASNFGVDGSSQLYIKSQGVNSDEILNGTIANVDVSSSAAIAESKLALNYGTTALHNAIGANTTNITANDGDITDLEAAVGSATGLAGLNYSSNNYVTDGEALETAVGDLDAQVKTNADAIAGITGGQQTAMDQNDFSGSPLALTATSWTDLAGVSIVITPTGKPIILNFSGTFDDRGGTSGAFIDIHITDGTNTSLSRTIILNDRDYHQTQEASINFRIASPATASTTYKVQYKIHGNYNSGQCVNGTLTLMEING